MSYKELESIYQKQYGKSIGLISDAQYEATRPLDHTYVLDLYRTRYDNLLENKKSRDAEFEQLLEELSLFKGDKIIVHGLTLENKITLYFTDGAISRIIGILNLSK